jgi:hypothetical protein
LISLCNQSQQKLFTFSPKSVLAHPGVHFGRNLC